MLSAYAVGVATVGENFKRIRVLKKIKQEQIYRQLGFQRASNVSLLETSQRLPKPRTIQRMAAVLGCETWELLENVNTPYDTLRHKADEFEGRLREAARKKGRSG